MRKYKNIRGFISLREISLADNTGRPLMYLTQVYHHNNSVNHQPNKSDGEN